MPVVQHQVGGVEVSNPEPRCETCQNPGTVHIEAVGWHFCPQCLEKVDARIAELNRMPDPMAELFKTFEAIAAARESRDTIEVMVDKEAADQFRKWAARASYYRRRHLVRRRKWLHAWRTTPWQMTRLASPGEYGAAKAALNPGNHHD